MSQHTDAIQNTARHSSQARSHHSAAPMKPMAALESKQREALFLQAFNGRLLGLQSYQLIINAVMIVIAVASISLVLTRPVKNQYFLIDNDGRLITQVQPLEQPLVATQKVRSFADDCVKAVLNIDFVHYKQQLTEAERCFTRSGFLQIVNLMKDRGLLSELSSGFNVGSIVPRQANFLRTSGIHGGRHKWLVKGVYVWSLKQGKSTVQYPLEIEVTLVQVPMSESVHGVAIDAMTIKRA